MLSKTFQPLPPDSLSRNVIKGNINVSLFIFSQNMTEAISIKLIKSSTWYITVNSLLAGDATWPHSAGSTFVQVMTCCLLAQSHIPLTFVDVWSVGSYAIHLKAITIKAHKSYHYNLCENYSFKIKTSSSRGQWVKALSITLKTEASDTWSFIINMWAGNKGVNKYLLWNRYRDNVSRWNL